MHGLSPPHSPQLNTLIVGLGRAGLGLHIPVLARLRLTAAPVVAVDPRAVTTDGHAPLGHTPIVRDPAERLPVAVARSLREARSRLPPDRTVVHLCTPPDVRASVLREVAALGFTNVIVEKPLAASEEELREVLSLKRRYGLRLAVVAPWLHSALTARLEALLAAGDLGRLLSVTITQHKPRFRRSLTSSGHASAFDVEVPHSLGLALRLAGDARVVAAESTDLRLDDVVVPAMGSARLTLHHSRGGVRTTITSDLTSPVRQRRVVLRLTGGRIVADYPIGEDDDVAQLQAVGVGDRPDETATTRQVLRDDALGAFLTHAYRCYAPAAVHDDAHAFGLDLDLDLGLDPDFGLDQHARGCRLLLDAKRQAAASAPARPVLPTTLERTP